VGGGRTQGGKRSFKRLSFKPKNVGKKEGEGQGISYLQRSPSKGKKVKTSQERTSRRAEIHLHREKKRAREVHDFVLPTGKKRKVAAKQRPFLKKRGGSKDREDSKRKKRQKAGGWCAARNGRRRGEENVRTKGAGVLSDWERGVAGLW